SHPDTLYAIAAGYGQLFRSDDRGLTWRTYCDTSWSFSRMDSRPTAVIDPGDEDVVYTLDNRGDLARFDGTTWTSLGVLDAAGGPGPQGNCVRTVAIDPRHPEVIYAAMLMPGGPIVLRTTDAGQNWQDITSNLSRSGGPSLQVNPYTGDLLQGSTYGTWVYPPPYASPDALYYKLADSVAIVRWESVADHGPAGEVAVTVDDGATECRLAGLSKLRLTFDGPLDPATVTAGAVTLVGDQGGDLSSRIASLALDDDCIELTVTFDAPLPDADTYHVAVADQVRAPDGDPVAGDRELVLHVLAGDADGSGSVTAADVLAVRSAAGQSAAADTAALDVDGSGTVTPADMLAVRRRLGAALP
ncbi:MAG: hypothetical protein JXL80_03125, partial [Planctomycetes bacterium]|nr:hypothetical protein [Planctomycetota bacterium]